MALRNKAFNRSVSYSRKEEYSHEESKVQMRRSDRPIHCRADSLFSTSSGFTNFSGFLNLGLIHLVLSNARVALENVIKYGILIEPLSWIVWDRSWYERPSFLLVVVVSHVFILTAFVIEKLIAKRYLTERICLSLHVINITLTITLPAGVVWVTHPFPVYSSLCLVTYVILFAKLISYVQVNGWCRAYSRSRSTAPGSKKHTRFSRRTVSASQQEDTDADTSDCPQPADSTDTEDKVEKISEPAVQQQYYPNNIRLGDLYYFIMAPTLCYELNFPRSSRIRTSFLVKRIVEMVFLLGLIMSLLQQWVLPAVRNSRVPFADMDYSKLLERLLKLAVPNHVIWLIFFYWFFHSCLNVIAEILMFGDRTFYKDWWNAQTVQYFWQNWNIPVHRWASRHLYKPLLVAGYSRISASIVVFVVSAVFHEYLVSIPLKMFRSWAFSGMMAQIPMAILIQKYFHGRYGNMLVWISIIIGQPFAILMYYHDYFLRHTTE